MPGRRRPSVDRTDELREFCEREQRLPSRDVPAERELRQWMEPRRTREPAVRRIVDDWSPLGPKGARARLRRLEAHAAASSDLPSPGTDERLLIEQAKGARSGAIREFPGFERALEIADALRTPSQRRAAELAAKRGKAR